MLNKDGLDIMRANRPKTGSELTNGPGKLMQAFGVTDLRWNNVVITDSPFSWFTRSARAGTDPDVSSIGVGKTCGRPN